MSANSVFLENLAAPSGWQGCLELEFSRQQGATQLSHSAMQAPLKVQRPFYPEGEAVCHVVTLHTAGGVVGGDRLATEITLHPQTHGLITTAAAGKLYRSNGLEAQQTTRIAIAAGACLEWLPQETIVFDGAIYRQGLRVDLAEEALWIGWEIVRFGRSARGEQFATGQWRSHTEVWQNGRPLWVDPQGMQGGSAMLTSQHGLAGCPVVGSFAVIGRSVSAEIIDQARSLWPPVPLTNPVNPANPVNLTEVGDRPAPNAPSGGNTTPAQVGVTRLMSGMLCRYRGHSTLEARRWFTAVWGLVRLEWLDCAPCKPRVW